MVRSTTGWRANHYSVLFLSSRGVDTHYRVEEYSPVPYNERVCAFDGAGLAGIRHPVLVSDLAVGGDFHVE